MSDKNSIYDALGPNRPGYGTSRPGYVQKQPKPKKEYTLEDYTFQWDDHIKKKHPIVTKELGIARGHVFELVVRDKLRAAFPDIADGIEADSFGSGGEDIKMTDEARAVLGVSIECKYSIAFQRKSAYAQALKYTPEGAIPCVVDQKDSDVHPLDNNGIIFVTLSLDDLIKLIKKGNMSE